MIIRKVDFKKIKRGERLQPSILELKVGESIQVPYRLFSENSIRSTISQMKANYPHEFNVNARSSMAAVITRTQ